ncbi:hypothetical protein [Nocardia sp. XZ_19_231]|uniref:hypothetical protein n=1 Tax=Nocardia sp. XZ_19_231 TaxID=2769252 RepID=UPI00188F4B96|nr:hypothetical protein [Nocardia sp. XZ_19_231]
MEAGADDDHDDEVFSMSCVQAMLTEEVSSSADPATEIEEVIGEANDALDEAAAEQEIHRRLVDCEARGPDWELVVERLSRYANEVLDPWIRTGAIYSRLACHHIVVDATYSERFRLAVNEDLRKDVLATTIASALVQLRNGICGGRGWNPHGGAKLTTYFLRGCLYAFKHAFAQILGGKREQSRSDGPDELADQRYPSLCDTGLGADPADIASNRDLIRYHLMQLDAESRRIVWAKAAGYTHLEIAELFLPNKTPKAIERKLARLAADHPWIANLSTRRSQ